MVVACRSERHAGEGARGKEKKKERRTTTKLVASGSPTVNAELNGLADFHRTAGASGSHHGGGGGLAPASSRCCSPRQSNARDNGLVVVAAAAFSVGRPSRHYVRSPAVDAVAVAVRPYVRAALVPRSD